jgi:Spy/CpxP family protein refolding chaperone
MNALMNSATASEEQVRAKYAEVESWRKKIVDNEFETRLAIRRVLPPELRLPFAIKLQENIDRAERTFERQRKSP